MMHAAPITLENQHWVMVPEAFKAIQLSEPTTLWSAQAVYASSPEAAVEQIRSLYRVGDFGEPVAAEGLDKIRLAEGVELPWNDPKMGRLIVTPKGGPERSVSDMDVETILDIYGPETAIRRASSEEAEAIIREDVCVRDQEDEEQFNYGFNVLYKEQIESMGDEG